MLKGELCRKLVRIEELFTVALGYAFSNAAMTAEGTSAFLIVCSSADNASVNGARTRHVTTAIMLLIIFPPYAVVISSPHLRQ